MANNHGFNKIRFITPVPVGAKLRARSRIWEVTRVHTAVHAALVISVEFDGATKPGRHHRIDYPLCRLMSAAARVATVQRVYVVLAGDRDALDRVLHPDFVGHAAAGLPLNMGGIDVGSEAMRTNLWWRIGEHVTARAVAEDFQPLDDGRLIVIGTDRGVARRSGARLDAAFVQTWEFDANGRTATLQQRTDAAACCAVLVGTGRLQTVDYRVDDGVAIVCLNRPEAGIATDLMPVTPIDLQMARDTLEVARRIAADASVRAVLSAAAGRRCRPPAETSRISYAVPARAPVSGHCS